MRLSLCPVNHLWHKGCPLKGERKENVDNAFEKKKERKQKWKGHRLTALSPRLRIMHLSFWTANLKFDRRVKAKDRNDISRPSGDPTTHPAPEGQRCPVNEASLGGWSPWRLSPSLCRGTHNGTTSHLPSLNKCYFSFRETNSVLNHRRLKLEKYVAHIIIKLF